MKQEIKFINLRRIFPFLQFFRPFLNTRFTQIIVTEEAVVPTIKPIFIFLSGYIIVL